LLELADERPRGTAYRVKQLGRVARGVVGRARGAGQSIGRGLLALWHRSGDRVAILADNRPEWFVATSLRRASALRRSACS